jgi:hypothetical protein
MGVGGVIGVVTAKEILIFLVAMLSISSLEKIPV